MRGRDFIKLHAAIEMQSQAFIAWEFTLSNRADVTMAPALLQRATGSIGRVFADSAYLSSNVCIEVHARGAEPWIRPKTTSRGRRTKSPSKGRSRPHETYVAMMDAYQADPAAWLRVYHQRSRIESAFGAFKQRLGAGVAAMDDALQRVELALKLVVWNITRVTKRGHF